ncbi:MAG: SAM-dependent methyltransferase [Desulfobacula sp.]|nr:SAM-dependent methyltransferase [Desulfobacula sp.]
MNERKNELLVNNYLKKQGYFDNDNKITVELQNSDFPKIKKLLKNASKRGDNQGYPDFIISSKNEPDLLIVIECKADSKKQVSETLDKYADYALDGAMLYASFLAKEYNVIAIGTSGESGKKFKIDHKLLLKGHNTFSDFEADKILAFDNYKDLFISHPAKFNADYTDLVKYSQKLNKKLHIKKVKEGQRSLLISAILISLKNEAFYAGYKGHKTGKQLANAIVQTIVNELESTEIPKEKIEALKYAYGFIKTHTILSSDKEFMLELIEEIDNKLNSFLKTHSYFDALGQFYIEFLRYANHDKGLGIVLTPPHITELFSELAEVNKDSVIYDNCCGTGGFLISAMKKMISSANGDNDKIKKIKNNQLIGVEFQDDIYALAVSNMIIHNDGMSNIFHDDCFEFSEKSKGKYKPTVGFLNPPYKSDTEDKEELEFTLDNLKFLENNSLCVSIIPISCVLAQDGENLELKKKILKNHTLEAVLSMPIELFNNSKVTVVTAIAVIRAHSPHPKNKETWFGLWRDDGFIKVKNKGRIDQNNTWKNIQNSWIRAYRNREIINGFSVSKEVVAEDEWCAEAFLVTDYSDINEDTFINELKKYSAFQVLNEDG